MLMIMKTLVLLVSLVLAISADDPEIFMNASQIIQHWGYPVEEYEVTTEDGYILGMQRIPHGRHNIRAADKRPVVFLQHGLLGSSTQWIANLPNQSLAFILADRGYDVWLGNSRGNTYSLKHTKLSTDTDEFWDFSFDDFAKYDLPASIEFALRCSKKRKLAYVGHSQGTSIGFAAFSTDQTLASKITVFVALAPVAYVGNMKSPIKYLSYFKGPVQWVTYWLGVRDFLPSGFATRFVGHTICEEEIGSVWCSNLMFVLCGYDRAQLNETRLPVYLAHTPAGTSVKDVVHYAQLYESGKFQKYDYGWFKNLYHYGQGSSPEYDVSKIKVPIAMFSADQDWLATPKDVDLLAKKLRSVVYRQKIEKWDHLDFIWGLDASTVIYKQIDNLLKKFSRGKKYGRLNRI